MSKNSQHGSFYFWQIFFLEEYRGSNYINPQQKSCLKTSNDLNYNCETYGTENAPQLTNIDYFCVSWEPLNSFWNNYLL